MDTQRDILHGYLAARRENLLAKLHGLDDYAVRRPLTPTGTNLLGLVKHVALVQLGYLGLVFGRPTAFDEVGMDIPDADLWAGPGESRADILELFRFSSEHADTTVRELPLDARGRVPWWGPERADVSLGQILVHLVAEVARHVGQADILREGLDGAVGDSPGDANITDRTPAEWAEHVALLEAVARAATQGASGSPTGP